MWGDSLLAKCFIAQKLVLLCPPLFSLPESSQCCYSPYNIPVSAWAVKVCTGHGLSHREVSRGFNNPRCLRLEPSAWSCDFPIWRCSAISCISWKLTCYASRYDLLLLIQLVKPFFQFLVGRVFAEPRKNRPPVAIVSPQCQEISLCRPLLQSLTTPWWVHISACWCLERAFTASVLLQPAVSEYCLDQFSWPC